MPSDLGASSKVTPPPPPPSLIHRPRLTERLTEGARGPLTLLSAGPGSGKTVLASAWAAEMKLPTAWLSLNAHDDDPTRLWSLVGRALLEAGIVAQTDGFGAFPHAADDSPAFLRSLLETVPGAPYVLIIDDAHHLTHPAILAELDEIVRYGFPKLRLVLSARSDPMLPIHRYRVAGQMCELRAADLAMTKSEAHALLSSHGVRLARHDVALLTHRTEGWAAGLRLSAMKMAQARYPAQFVTQLALDQGSVGAYLMEEVLAHQSDVVRRLLVQTSFLEEITGPLADAVTGIDGCTSLLAELSRTNSFVVRLEHDGERYRYHQLMREILSYLLGRQGAKALGELRSRAATWYESQGDAASAMRSAAAAGQWSHVSSILVHGGFARAVIGRWDLRELGVTDLTISSPETAPATVAGAQARIARAAVASVAGDLAGIEADLETAREVALSLDARVTADLAEVMAAHRAGNPALIDRAAARLLDTDPFSADGKLRAAMRAAVRIEQASTHLWSEGPVAEVQSMALDGLAEARSGEVPRLELEVLGLLQLLHTAAGHSGRARQCQMDSQSLTRQFPHLQRLTLHHTAQAYAALLGADVTAAEQDLRRAQQTMLVDADAGLQTAVVLLRSWTMVLAGLLTDAQALLLTAPEMTRALPARLARTRALTIADIETRLGRPDEALRLIDELASLPRDPATAIVSTRALLALGDTRAAKQALRPTVTAREDIIPLPTFIDALLASARIADLNGDDAKAVREIVRAADLAGGTIAAPFVDNLQALEPLLCRHAEARASWPGNGQSIESIPLQRSGRADDRRGAVSQTLTERETEVLRRLAMTMTTAEISEVLCISMNTVKTHIAAIYRKLPATGRRDAIARARHLALL